MIRTTVLAVAGALLLASNVLAQQVIGGCPVLPSNNIWNTPVDTLPVQANSATLVNTIGAGRGFHPDFGSGLWEGAPMGIPFVLVPGSQQKYPVTFDYSSEADPGPYAVPLNAPIEGGAASTGDRHTMAIDTTNCILYELYNAFPQSNSWIASSGAIFDLKSNALRPYGWTSTDAAGLPIVPGLITYDEVASGEIKHALRFTAPQTRAEFVWPARHLASSLTGSQYPRMGERLRLKASFDITPYPADVQVILRAMKKYGIMLADNGSAWYLTGAPDDRWNNDTLSTLRSVLGSNLEAVDATVLMVDPNSGATNVQRAGTGQKAGDFDGDRKADVSVYRPTTGGWWVLKSGTNFQTYSTYGWGLSADVPAPGDYDGDGKLDLAIYRPSTGVWWISKSSTNYATNTSYAWGLSGDVPMPADYDGDGKTDIAIYRPSNGGWWILKSSTGFSTYSTYGWGLAGDVPTPGDYDGDGKADPAIYRPTTGGWWILKSSANYGAYSTYGWGLTGDVPVASDFDGDGKTDLAIYRPTTGGWWILKSSTNFGTYSTYGWGLGGDVPVPADFDGDGKADLAVYRPTTGGWWILKSSANFASYSTYGWGLVGDVPVLKRP